MKQRARLESPADRARFRQQLGGWFQRRGRDLPWRRTRDPYAILVSELMLQQTQVATVLPYYAKWLARFPDFAHLARASESAVLHAWQGLGYYARARNLHAAAKFVVANFDDGILPADRSEIARLPGVGRYTAGAVASFAFDLPAAVVDANIARLLARLTNLQTPVDSSAGRDKLWQTAEVLLPATGSRAHNSALMDLGAMICVARKPRCDQCPVRRYCQAEQPELLPIKKKRPRTVRLTEPHGFSRGAKRVLLEQSAARWRGMWILPRLASTPKRDPLLSLEFPFTNHRITLAVFRCAAKRPTPEKRQRWFPLRALAAVPMPTPHRRALARLLSIGN